MKDEKPDVWSARRPMRDISFVFLLALTGVLSVISTLVGWEFPGDASRPTLRFCLLLVCASLVAGVAARFLYLAAPVKAADAVDVHTLGDRMFRQCFAMANYAFERGRPVPGPVAVTVAEAQHVYHRPQGQRTWEQDMMERLAVAHAALSTLLAPALPKALVPLSFRDDPTTRRYAREALPWLGTVRLVRMMLTLALVLVPAFVVLALLVGSDFRSGAQLLDGNLVHRLGKGLYLVVTAALGASFSALFKARRYVEDLSYDDQYESSYWVRFTQGLVAGLLLAVLLSNLLPSQSASTLQLSIPLLALVGGFSSDLVYRLLKRVIDAIETLVQGSASERLTAAANDADNRLKRQAEINDARLAGEVARAQRGEVEAMLGLLSTIPDTPDNAEARSAVSRRLREVLQMSESADHAEPDPPAVTRPGPDPAGHPAGHPTV